MKRLKLKYFILSLFLILSLKGSNGHTQNSNVSTYIKDLDFYSSHLYANDFLPGYLAPTRSQTYLEVLSAKIMDSRSQGDSISLTGESIEFEYEILFKSGQGKLNLTKNSMRRLHLQADHPDILLTAEGITVPARSIDLSLPTVLRIHEQVKIRLHIRAKISGKFKIQGDVRQLDFATHKLKPLADSSFASSILIQSREMDLLPNQRFLFIDSANLSSSENVNWISHSAEKTGISLLSKTDGIENGDLGSYFTVLYDGSKYQMFYEAQSEPVEVPKTLPSGTPDYQPRANFKLYYAESTDGLHWKKPYRSPIFEGTTAPHYEGKVIHGACVSIDSSEPLGSKQRYKMIFGDARAEYTANDSAQTLMKAAVSSDGINWKPFNSDDSASNPPPILSYHADTQASCFRDPKTKEWVVYHRSDSGANQSFLSKRQVLRSHWAGFKPTLKFNTNYNQDLPIQTAQNVIHNRDFDGPAIGYYNPAAFAYSEAQDVYLAFPSLMKDEARLPTPTSLGRSGYLNQPQTLEPYLMVSRDGIHWSRVSGNPFISKGEGLDSGMIFMSPGVFPIKDSYSPIEKVAVYYSGTPLKHNEINLTQSNRQMNIFMATLRKDGFVSAETDSKQGSLTTLPFTAKASEFHLNAEVYNGGSLLLEILDAETQLPLPNFSSADFDPITENSTNIVARWRGRSAIPHVLGKKIQLKFYLKQAALYSFWYVEPNLNIGLPLTLSKTCTTDKNWPSAWMPAGISDGLTNQVWLSRLNQDPSNIQNSRYHLEKREFSRDWRPIEEPLNKFSEWVNHFWPRPFFSFGKSWLSFYHTDRWNPSDHWLTNDRRIMLIQSDDFLNTQLLETALTRDQGRNPTGMNNSMQANVSYIDRVGNHVIATVYSRASYLPRNPGEPERFCGTDYDHKDLYLIRHRYEEIGNQLVRNEQDPKPLLPIIPQSYCAMTPAALYVDGKILLSYVSSLGSPASEGRVVVIEYRDPDTWQVLPNTRKILIDSKQNAKTISLLKWRNKILLAYGEETRNNSHVLEIEPSSLEIKSETLDLNSYLGKLGVQSEALLPRTSPNLFETADGSLGLIFVENRHLDALNSNSACRSPSPYMREDQIRVLLIR